MNEAGSRLSGKRCIITGGASGLGRAMAIAFVEQGAQVLITDINEVAGNKTAKEIGVMFAKQDVTDEDRWPQIIEICVGEFGGLDVLVNNAGLAQTGEGLSPEDSSLGTWRKMFAVNVEGVFLGCRAALPAMRESGGGSIINLSSLAALVPTPFFTAYGASKAAVTHLSTSVAMHGAPDQIRCNSVHPGQIQTDMHNALVADAAAKAGAPLDAVQADFASRIPMGKFQQAKDIANMVLFLASDESAQITGTQMVVDGGMQLIN
ncbi:MAG: SDR family oxidoreductase [Robiginitomaculum sp.]|nr:SDR family oxidoreductase [Robiginitomaculum sp.]